MLHSLLPPLANAELPAKTTTEQPLPAVAQALATAHTAASTAWQLLVWSLQEATEGLLLVDDTQHVQLLNTLLCQLFDLSSLTAELVGQPAKLVEAQLRLRLASPTTLDILLAHPAVGYVPLLLTGGQVLEVKVQHVPTPAGGGYLLRSRAQPTATTFPGHSAEGSVCQPLRPPCPTAPASLLDLTYLHTQAQGTQALITKVINSFLRNTPPLLLELRAAADTGDWDTVTRLVHHLRSNMQVLGIRQAEACLTVLQPPLPPATGPAAEAFARATHQLADCLSAALRALPSYLP
jgi:HPt (histidine-containing phosphotransfer) domain-containing protein